MSKVIVISGLPGAGKSTVAKRLANGFERSVHLEADQIHRMIINGGKWPDEDDIRGNKNVFHQSEALFDITMNETPKRGLWLDTSQHTIEQTVDEIQQRFEQEALLC